MSLMQSTYPHDLVGRSASPPTPPTLSELSAARAARRESRAADQLGQQPVAAGDWRLAGSLVVLGDEANEANPNRDKASDGTIGDAAHASRDSDHNPWVVVAGRGVVRARDIDTDGLDLVVAFERARQAAFAGLLPQLVDGGYLILNRRITTEDFSGWKVYKGPNPHTLEGHVSVSTDPVRFDDRRPWAIFGIPAQPGPAPAPAPAPAPVPPPPAPAPVNVRLLERGPDNYQPGDPRRDLLVRVQNRLRTRYPLYAKRLAGDGWFGPATEAAVREFQRRVGGLVVDGIVGEQTLRRLGL